MTITLYTKNNCGFCMMAKGFLKNHGFTFEEINVEQETSAREFLITEGHRTMPQIYKDGKLLVPGGWEGLNKLGVNGLKEKLTEKKIDVSELGGI